MNRILKPETGCASKIRPSKNLRDVLIKLDRYLNTLFSEHNDSIDTFFCEEERAVLFRMLDQVEATLPHHVMTEDTYCQLSHVDPLLCAEIEK